MDDKKKARGGSSTASSSKQHQQQQQNGVKSNSNKRRKNRRRRNPQQRKGGGGNQSSSVSSRGVPVLPTVKITIRNIRDTDVIQTIRSLITNVNASKEEKSSLSPSSAVASSDAIRLKSRLVLDETHLQKLIRDMQMAQEAKEKWMLENESKSTSAAAASATTAATASGVETNGTKTPNDSETINDSTSIDTLISAMDKSLTVSQGTQGTGDSHDINNVQVVGTDNHHDKAGQHHMMIDVRVLYYVPPKKTRRRGQKPGVAYLLLTAPPLIEATSGKSDLHPISEEIIDVDSSSTNTVGDIVGKAPVTLNGTSTAGVAQPSSVRSVIDYSRDIAQRQLLLEDTLEALQVIVKEQQSTAMMNHKIDPSLWMMVEVSKNSKVWKQQSYMASSPVDRMAGSIFTNDDYLQFITSTQRIEEERKARPKPPPGGGAVGNTNTPVTTISASASGMASTTMTTTTTTTTASTTAAAVSADGKPVAAVVLHLQKKQEEEKMRKLAKRSTGSSSSKGKDSRKVSGTSNTKRGTATSAAVKPKAILTNGRTPGTTTSSGVDGTGTATTIATSSSNSNNRSIGSRNRRSRKSKTTTDSTTNTIKATTSATAATSTTTTANSKSSSISNKNNIKKQPTSNRSGGGGNSMNGTGGG